MEELYRSSNLVVRRVAAADLSRWVVTFDNHSIGVGFDRPAFGEHFLAGIGVSAIHILGRGDDWYQYPDIADAIAAARAGMTGATHVCTYGSSMGGYAAIRFADAIGATSVLALSPQYSNDPSRVAWEKRWTQDAHRIAWLPELATPLHCRCRPVIIFDPTSDDQRHAASIQSEVRCEAIALPYGGHPVGQHLAEMGMLHPIVSLTLDGTLDADLIRREAHAKRRLSSIYFAELAERQPESRPRTAIMLARRALVAAPGGVQAMVTLARLLTRLGEYDEALELHERAAIASGRKPVPLIHQADALLAVGDVEAAVPIAAEVVRGLPTMAHLANWNAMILWRAGQYPEAIAEQERAVALDPVQPHYVKVLRTYRKAREAAATHEAFPAAGTSPLGRVRRALAITLLRARHIDEYVRSKVASLRVKAH